MEESASKSSALETHTKGVVSNFLGMDARFIPFIYGHMAMRLVP